MASYNYGLDRTDSMIRYMEEKMERNDRRSQEKMQEMMMRMQYHSQAQQAYPAEKCEADPCSAEEKSCPVEAKADKKQDRDLKGLIAYYYHRKS